jgi:hypothetical protein
MESTLLIPAARLLRFGFEEALDVFFKNSPPRAAAADLSQIDALLARQALGYRGGRRLGTCFAIAAGFSRLWCDLGLGFMRLRGLIIGYANFIPLSQGFEQPKYIPNLHIISGRVLDFCQPPGLLGADFQVDLIRLQLEQSFPHFYPLAFLLVPLVDGGAQD